MTEDLSDFFEEIDAPRALPDELRNRLEAALIAGTGPRPIPTAARRRISRRLREPARRAPQLRTAALVAAALLTMLGSVAVFTTDSKSPATRRTTVNDSQTASGNGDSSQNAFGANQSSGGSSTATTVTPAQSGGLGAAAARSAGRGPLAVSLVGGDTDAEKGFRAYAASATRPATITVVAANAPANVTVNFSQSPIAAPSGRILMEGLAAEEAQLTGSVFDVASVVEHSARIAASSAFPTSERGRRAVIYTGQQEPFATRIPSAVESVLRRRGVSALRIPFDGRNAPLLTSASAAFLSLPASSVRPWLRAAKSADYAPARGTWGFYTAANESFLGDMTGSVRVVSPFAFPSATESDELRAAAGSLSASAIHGWLTAKYLTFAAARSNGTTPEALSAALSALRGFEDGFAPPYDVRANTNSRLADAVVLAPTGARFEVRGPFVRDDA